MSTLIYSQYINFFLKLDKSKPANLIKFNVGNEFAVNLFKNKLIKYTDIYKIIRKVVSLNLNSPLNSIKDVINYHEKLKKLKYIFRIFYSLTIFLIISLNASSNEIIIEVKGNNFTDESAIFALIENPGDYF